MRAAIENALEGGFERGFEKEHEIGQGGEIVNAADPLRRATAHGVAGKGGEEIAVAEDKVSGAKQRGELAFVAIGKVRGMDQTEGGGERSSRFLPLLVAFLTSGRNSIR